MRITTSMMVGNFQANLNTSINNLSNLQNKVLTGRSFNSVAEDPGAAIRAASLERQYAKNDDYISLVKDLQSRLDSQEGAMSELVTYAKKIAKDEALQALNGTNSAQAKIYAQSFRTLQTSMVQSMNTTYGNTYVMAGADTDNLPFQLSEDGKQLFYRGIDVSTGLDKNGNPADPTLAELAKETQFQDLGFGLTSDASGAIIPSSAYDMCLPGIKVLGYGQENGMDKNLITLTGQLADVLETEPMDTDKFKNLLAQFGKAYDNVLNCETELGVKYSFLDNTKTRLEDSQITLSTQIDSLVNVDMSMAITNYSYAQYVYNAALRVGVNILSPSFLDFMN